MINYLKLFTDGTSVATKVAPSYGKVSTEGDYFINDTWYDKNGTVYNPQFTYARDAETGKLIGFEVNNGEVSDIHIEDTESNELSPDLVLPSLAVGSAEMKNLKVTDGFDLGQQWVSVIDERSVNIEEINNTDKPIEVAINVFGDGVYSTSILIDSKILCNFAYPSTARNCVTFTVPPKSTYRLVVDSSSSITVNSWLELR